MATATKWKGRIDACREFKRDNLTTWQDNVSRRRGKPFRTKPTEDTVNVPQDWSRTKNKSAQLFYQVPKITLKARRPEFVSVAPVFAAALNFQLHHKVKLQHAMNECLGDVINAAGVGICMIGYDATFEDVELPTYDPATTPPEAIAQMEAMGQPLTEKSKKAIYECYFARRISPAHFLFPVEFVGSDWQEAPWLGHEGYMLLAEAQRKEWVDADFEGAEMQDREWLLSTESTNLKPSDKYVKYCQIVYKAALQDPKEKDLRKLKRIVIVDGLPEDKAVVVDEDFEWQKYVPETRGWVGLTTFPYKVLTLTNISDMAIPPSDSEIGWPQVKELIRGRSQMLQQRTASFPLRWFDVNMVDEEIADALRKGNFQHMIPMNGPGDHAIGVVDRAQFPRENFEFDAVAKQDLDEAWSMGAPQQGVQSQGETTATEVKDMRTSLNVRLSYEQSWVLQFIIEIAQGIGSLMQMFSDQEDYVEVEGPQNAQVLTAWNKDTIPGEYIFEAKVDSAQKLDANQQRSEALNLYKLLRRDPLANPQEILKLVFEAWGMDPGKSMAQPQPPQPPPDKRSFAFKGENMQDPIAVALIQKGPNPITPEDIKAAKELIAAAGTLQPEPPAPPSPILGPTGEPAAPHPGPVQKVEGLDKRYEQSGTSSAEGSRDSGMPGG